MCHLAITSFQTLRPLSPQKVMDHNFEAELHKDWGVSVVLTCLSPGSLRQCRSCSRLVRCLCPRCWHQRSWPRWWESRRWPRLSGRGSSASSGGRGPGLVRPQPPRWAGCGSRDTGLACPPWPSRPRGIFEAPEKQGHEIPLLWSHPCQVTLSLGRSGSASSYSCKVVGSKDTGWNRNPPSEITIWSLSVKWNSRSLHWLGDKWYG